MEEEEEVEEAMIGPPRPPPRADEEEDDGPIIGPPRPPMDLIGSDTDDEDGDLDGEEENRYRIPLSNEIVLKGHTKVNIQFPRLALPSILFCFYF